jgi:hypothetical protein
MKIITFLCLTAVAALAIVRPSPLSVGFLGVLIIAAAVDFAAARSIEKNLSIGALEKSAVGYRKNKIVIGYRLENGSPFLIPRITATVCVRRGSEKIMKKVKSICAKKIFIDTAVNLYSPHCAVYETNLESVTFETVFFRFKKRLKHNHDYIAVIPEPKYNPVDIPPISKRENSEQKIPNTEFSDVRPYRDGDSLSRIHYKLSARTDDWFVKEYKDEATDRTPETIIHCKPKTDYSDEKNDTIFGDTAAAAKIFTAAGQRVTIVLDGYEISPGISFGTPDIESSMAVLVTLFAAARGDIYEKK